MTRMYLHVATNSTANLPTTEQSTNTSVYSLTPVTTNFFMDDVIGTAQVVRPTSGTSSAVGKTYIGRWVSPPLGSATTQIDANTWTLNFAATDAGSNKFPVAGTNTAMIVCAYVWRPGTGKVGSNIADTSTTNTSATFQVGTTTEKVEHGTFSGAQVTGVQAGDVICVELWSDTIGGGTGWAYGVYFDGTTVNTTAAATVSNHAAFVETPQTLALPIHVNKTVSETVSISEGPVRLSSKIRPISTQTVTISDSIIGYYSHPLFPVTVSSSVAITVVHPSGNNVQKSLTETVSISTSALSRLAAKIRTATDTITITSPSPLSRLAAKIRTATDTITISSTPARLLTKIRSLTESVTTTPTTLARIKGAVKAITQTATISDAVTKTKGSVKAITSTVTISDALTILRNKIRTITTTITISSTPTRLNTLVRTITQTIAISSTVTKSKGAIKALTETVTILSTLARLVAKIRTATETVTISSTVTKLAAKIRTLSQTITISDVVARTIGARAITKTLTETITIATASLTRLAAKTRTATDSITIVSTPTKLSSKFKSLTESISIISTVQRIKGAVKVITETITIASTVSRLNNLIRSITTTITVADSVTRAKAGAQNIFKSLTESITIASTVNRTQTKIRALSDTISLTPSILTRLVAKTRTSTDTITIGAGIATRLRGLVRTSTTSLNAISTLTRLAQKIRTLSQSITIQDQAIGLGPSTIPVGKQPPRPSVSILAQELRYVTTKAKDIQRMLYETVHVSDLPRLYVKRYSKIIRTAKVKKIVRILDLVKMADDIYNRSGKY